MQRSGLEVIKRDSLKLKMKRNDWLLAEPIIIMTLISRVRVLYHQFAITNHNESILKSKTMSILMNIFVCLFFSI